MKMKFLASLLTITILSCNTPASELETNASTQVNKISNEEDTNFPFKIEQFIFSKVVDEINYASSGYFKLTIEFTNNTQSKIINGKLENFLEISFKHLKPFKRGGEYQGRYSGMPYVVNKDNPWLPNTKRKFIIYFGQPLSDFEETPKSIYLKFAYNFYSIDDEYNSRQFKYDILSEWKDFQTKLGLR